MWVLQNIRLGRANRVQFTVVFVMFCLINASVIPFDSLYISLLIYLGSFYFLLLAVTGRIRDILTDESVLWFFFSLFLFSVFLVGLLPLLSLHPFVYSISHHRFKVSEPMLVFLPYLFIIAASVRLTLDLAFNYILFWGGVWLWMAGFFLLFVLPGQREKNRYGYPPEGLNFLTMTPATYPADLLEYYQGKEKKAALSAQKNDADNFSHTTEIQEFKGRNTP